MSEIVPAILPGSIEDLKDKLAALPVEVTFFHFDVLEGDIWSGRVSRDFEAHLMVREPEKIFDRWIDRGAKRIIVHKPEEGILRLQGKIEIGLGVELGVALEDIFPFIPRIDFVHLMSIDALGTQGDDFEPIIFDRIKRVKEKFPQVTISVDGGINITNYQALQSSGAERLVVGSGFQELWKSLTRN